MANSVLRRLNAALGMFCFMVLMQKSSARQFIVGGAKGWSVSADNSTLGYNQWAEKNRFQVGDSIVFNYPADKDSVLQVTQEAYDKCSTDAPIAKFSDGHSIVTFKQSGPHYFISGNKDNCNHNEKLLVVVMADRSKRSPAPAPVAAPPAGSKDVLPPAPAPTDIMSPPPAGIVDVNPTPAPESPPNAASSAVIGFISSIGAFAASSILLAL